MFQSQGFIIHHFKLLITEISLFKYLVKNLLQLAEEEGLHSFLELVRTAELEQSFNDFGDYTLFIPTEEAMSSKF